MSKTPLQECREEREALGTLWLNLQDEVLRTYKTSFKAKGHTDPYVVLRHMAGQHSELLLKFQKLIDLTGYRLCPDCHGDKTVLHFTESTVTSIPCPTCNGEGIKRDAPL